MRSFYDPYRFIFFADIENKEALTQGEMDPNVDLEKKINTNQKFIKPGAERTNIKAGDARQEQYYNPLTGETINTNVKTQAQKNLEAAESYAKIKEEADAINQKAQQTLAGTPAEQEKTAAYDDAMAATYENQNTLEGEMATLETEEAAVKQRTIAEVNEISPLFDGDETPVATAPQETVLPSMGDETIETISAA